jgi:hypothetical protein
MNPVPYRRTFRIGAWIFGCSMAVALLPWVIPLGDGARFVVAFALAGVILGANCLINGAIDWLRRRP